MIPVPRDVLDRLRQLAEAEMAEERWKARWAKRLGLAFGLAIALFLLWVFNRA